MNNSYSQINVINKTLTNANQEYSQDLSSFCGKFSIKARQIDVDLKISFVQGESGTTYWTIFAGSADENIGTFPGVKTVYVQSTTAGAIVEIIEFIS